MLELQSVAFPISPEQAILFITFCSFYKILNKAIPNNVNRKFILFVYCHLIFLLFSHIFNNLKPEFKIPSVFHAQIMQNQPCKQ